MERSPRVELLAGQGMGSFINESRGLYAAGKSFPAGVPGHAGSWQPHEQSAAGPTTERLIYYNHDGQPSPARAVRMQRMAELVRDCDILGIEAILVCLPGETEEMAQAREKRDFDELNDYLARPDEERQSTNTPIPKLLRQFDFLRGENKIERVVRLDVGLQHAQALKPLVDRQEAAAVEVSDTVHFGTGAYADLKRSVTALEAVKVDILLFRNDVVAQQRAQLIAQYPGRTIGIAVGLGHHVQSRMLVQEGLVQQRQFPEEAVQQRAKYDPDLLTRKEQAVDKVTAQLSVVSDALHVSNQAPEPELSFVTLFTLARELSPVPAYLIGALEPAALSVLMVKVESLWGKRINCGQSDAWDKVTSRRRATQDLFAEYLGPLAATI